MEKKTKTVLTAVFVIMGLLAAAYVVLYFIGKSDVEKIESLNREMEQQIDKLKAMKASGQLR